MDTTNAGGSCRNSDMHPAQRLSLFRYGSSLLEPYRKRLKRCAECMSEFLHDPPAFVVSKREWHTYFYTSRQCLSWHKMFYHYRTSCIIRTRQRLAWAKGLYAKGDESCLCLGRVFEDFIFLDEGGRDMRPVGVNCFSRTFEHRGIALSPAPVWYARAGVAARDAEGASLMAFRGPFNTEESPRR